MVIPWVQVFDHFVVIDIPLIVAIVANISVPSVSIKSLILINEVNIQLATKGRHCHSVPEYQFRFQHKTLNEISTLGEEAGNDDLHLWTSCWSGDYDSHENCREILLMDGFQADGN